MLTYVLNGGTNDATNPATYTVEDTPVTIKDPSRAGYTFLRWTEGNTIAKGETGAKTFTAEWSDAIAYDITYVLNGGTNDATNPATYTVDSPTITLKNPTRAGYTFNGWTPSDNIPAGSTGNKEFTATWTLNGVNEDGDNNIWDPNGGNGNGYGGGNNPQGTGGNGGTSTGTSTKTSNSKGNGNSQ